MDLSFYFFAGLCLVLIGALGYFLRDTVRQLSQAAAANAKTNATKYLKGGALMLIAAGASFETAYSAQTPAMQAALSWAPFAIFFWKPITGALAILVAVLDRQAPPDSQPAKP